VEDRGKVDPTRELGAHPWQRARWCEARIDEIRGELAVVETFAGTGSEIWEAVEEELLDELTELELFLMAYTKQGRRRGGGFGIWPP